MGRTSILEQTLVGWDTAEAAEYCATPSPAANPEAGDPPPEPKADSQIKADRDDSLPPRKERWPD